METIIKALHMIPVKIWASTLGLITFSTILWIISIIIDRWSDDYDFSGKELRAYSQTLLILVVSLLSITILSLCFYTILT